MVISIKISWDDVMKMVRELAEQINKDKFVPDYIIGISRGGYFPVAFINKMLRNWARITFVDIERDKDEPDKRIIIAIGFLRGKFGLRGH